MGIAAYNRGSMAISRQIDQEILDRRIAAAGSMKAIKLRQGIPLDTDKYHCQRCGHAAFAGNVWHDGKWWWVCWSCKQESGHIGGWIYAPIK